VPAGVDDALVGHAEDECADHGADDGAASTGHGHATDDGGDDVEELIAHALAGLDGVEGEQVVHAQEPGGETDEHEQGDLHALDGNTDRAGGLLVTADGEDPVAEAGLEQQVGAQSHEQDPPEDGDADVDAEDGDGAGEHRTRGGETLHVGDGRGGHGPRNELGQCQVEALQHEEGRQGDEEGGDPCLHHQVAVEETDGQGDHQCQQGTHPGVEPQVVTQHGGGQCGGGDGDTSGQVEFITDHEQAHGDRHDADGGAG